MMSLAKRIAIVVCIGMCAACAKKTDTTVTDSSGMTTNGTNYNSSPQGAPGAGSVAPTTVPPDTNAQHTPASNGVDSGMGRADTMKR